MKRELSSTFIVARVQPKMSKGITDLLLLDASFFLFCDRNWSLESPRRPNKANTAQRNKDLSL